MSNSSLRRTRAGVRLLRNGDDRRRLAHGLRDYEIRGDSAHLIPRKLLDDLMHSRRGAQIALDDKRLLCEIVGVLTSEPRKNIVASSLRAVAGRTGWNTLRTDSFFKDLLAVGHELCIARLGP